MSGIVPEVADRSGREVGLPRVEGGLDAPIARQQLPVAIIDGDVESDVLRARSRADRGLIPRGAARSRRSICWLQAVCVLAASWVCAAPAHATPYQQQTLGFSGLTGPLGVAVDGSGDVFVADASTDRVVELTAGGSQITLPFNGLAYPDGVAVDRSGDVFVADDSNNRVVELPVGGSQITLPFSGLSIPAGVAVDGSGDVFVADTNNSRVVELPAGRSRITLAFTGLGPPYGVAVDGSGDVFAADANGDKIWN